MNCHVCYSYPCICISPCSSLPCDITIKDYTPCPRDCYQVWVSPKYDLFTGQYFPCHYEYVCRNGTHPPQPQHQPCHQPPLIGGCAGTRYGCCNDGVTSKVDSQGSNCPQPPLIGGCAGTQFGCCNDGVTSKIDPQGSNCNNASLCCLPTCPTNCHQTCIHYQVRH